MKSQNYTITMTVDASPRNVFESINQVSGWWTEHLEGNSQNMNDVFTVRFGDVHVSTQKLVELVPERKVVWLVTGSHLNFVKNKQEWNDTKIIFEITGKGAQTQVRFTHAGLVPDLECFNGCSNAWGMYIKGSLFKLITEGTGVPELK